MQRDTQRENDTGKMIENGNTGVFRRDHLPNNMKFGQVFVS